MGTDTGHDNFVVVGPDFFANHPWEIDFAREPLQVNTQSECDAK